MIVGFSLLSTSVAGILTFTAALIVLFLPALLLSVMSQHAEHPPTRRVLFAVVPPLIAAIALVVLCLTTEAIWSAYLLLLAPAAIYVPIGYYSTGGVVDNR